MRYYVTILDKTFMVELSDRGATVNGVPVEAELSTVPGTAARSLAAGGRVHALQIGAAAGAKGTWDFHLDGERYIATVRNQRQHDIAALTGATARAAGPRPIKAPMPGLIVRVEVAAGDQVRPGQGVVIIEAMKMENELRAETAATVSTVHVTAGQAVEKGTVLVEFSEE